MKLQNLCFKNYRNLGDFSLNPDENVNLIYGENAQGKTNIIEAIWLFTGEKSFRGSKDSELIDIFKRDEEMSLKINYYCGERDNDSEIKIIDGKRKIIINDVPRKGTSALIGKFCAVVFSPENLSLIKGSPVYRRDFIDNAICQTKPLYSKVLYQYEHTLFQRNSLLKDILKHRELKDTIEIWDERLSFFGSKIIKQRLEYIDKIKEYSKKIYYDISGKKEEIDILYISTIGSEKDIYENMIEEYKESFNDDINLGYTTKGPHRDDIDFKINGLSAKNFGSQGQQRSVVLTLKFAEAEILSETLGEKPVLLLDDVMSELDYKRQEYVLNHIDGYQVFITCCDIKNTENFKNGSVFHIDQGKIEREE